MIGNLLSKVVKIATVPLDLGDAVVDIMTGGDGKKQGRKHLQDSIPCLSSLRDAACDVLEDLDK